MDIDVKGLIKTCQVIRHEAKVVVIDKDNSNYRNWGTVENFRIYEPIRGHKLRQDWADKLRANDNNDPEYCVVRFGSRGYGSDTWAGLFHKSQLINVNLLGYEMIKLLFPDDRDK
jgi:ribosomal protein L36